MKKIFTPFFGIGLAFSSFSQNLDNTVWSFPDAKVTQIAGLIGGLDSAKVFFEAPDLFYVEFYNQGQTSTSFNGSYLLNIPNNTAQLVDSTNATGFCNPIDLVTCDYAVVDTVLTLSNVQSACNSWELIIPGDYYLDAALTTNGLTEFSSFEFGMYPNPAKDFVSFSKEMELIEVYDLNGKRLLFAENASSLLIDDLSNGIYQVKVTKGAQQSQQKLVKE